MCVDSLNEDIRGICCQCGRLDGDNNNNNNKEEEEVFSTASFMCLMTWDIHEPTINGDSMSQS